VRITQHDVNVMWCSNSSTAHWPLQGVLSSPLGLASAAQHRRDVCSRDLTAAEAALRGTLPYSLSGVWDAASHAAASQVQLSWGRKPCVTIQFDGFRPTYAA
jgi:hypothetical protein